MDRRTLLKLMAAASLASGAGCSLAQGRRVIVAGAGIVGASIAYHLAKAGAEVTVIDKQGPASHASRGSFAWINATYAKQPRHYHQLSQQGVSGWHTIAAELGIPVRWGGSLEWFSGADRQEKLARQIAEQEAWGEDARMLSVDDAQAIDPDIEFADASSVAFSGNDGAVDPVIATNLLLDGAQRLGAQLLAPCELIDVMLNEGRVTAVLTSCGRLEADRLVLATGAASDAADKFARTELPQRTTPGVIAITKPTARRMNHIIAAPGVHMHQRVDGRIVIGEQEGAPDTHTERLQGRPNDFPSRELALEHAGRMLAIADIFSPGMAADIEIEDVYIGWRPLPLDGHPVLGASPNRPDVYLAVMHSGISLAPVVGQLVAHEVTRGESLPGLAPYRPGRNFEHVKRY